MDDELRKKVLEDLERSGFASEMNAISIFRRQGWKCSGNAGYFDRDEEKTREIDVTAYRAAVLLERTPDVSCFFHLVAEVKRSDKPWIVFRTSSEVPRLDAWNNLTFYDNLLLSADNMAEDMSRNSLLLTCGWEGHGIHECFKPPEQPSKWYRAFTSACKAADDLLEAESWNRQEGFDPRKSVDMVFVKPIVIIDALLFAADLDADGSIGISAIPWAPIRFEYQTRNYNRRGYSVDLVTLGSLPDYIRLCEARHDDITRGVLRLTDKAMSGKNG